MIMDLSNKAYYSGIFFKKYLYAICLFFLIISKTYSIQGPEMKFKYFGQKEGLSNTFVTCVIQDKIGYLWIGTFNGLNRFDGNEFKTYYASLNDSNQLPHHHIISLFNDSKGTLWISTSDGLCSYNREKDNFKRYTFDQRYSESDFFQTGNVAEDNHGIIYVNSSGIIYRWNPSKEQFIPYIFISSGNISTFLIDKNNNFWIAGLDGGGLTFYDSQKKESLKYDVSKEFDPKYLLSSEIQDIVFKDEKLWIGTRGEGLLCLDTASNTFEHHPIRLPDTDQILDLFVDNNNRLWTIDYTGLKLYIEDTDTFWGYYPSNNVDYSIKNLPSGIYQDAQDNYWICHYGGGIGLRTPPKGFYVISDDPDLYWHIVVGGVASIAKDRHGNLWMATSHPGIDIFNYQTNQIEYLRHEHLSPTSLGGGTIFTIFKDKDNQMWVGSYDGGLQLYNYDKNNFKRYMFDESDPYSISCNDVRAIDQDLDGNLWCVTHGKGVDKFDLTTKRFENYNNFQNNLSNPWTSDVLCDSKGDVWVSSVWGLNLLRKGKTRFENYYFNQEDTSSLCSSNVNTVFKDRNGNIWVGTDKGLNKYIEEDNSFIRYNKGFSNLIICSIQDDVYGKIWVSTLRGISMLSPTSGEVINFDESDGIQKNEFMYRSSYQSSDGEIYFGGIDGVTTFNPTKIKFNHHKPPVVISNVTVLNESTDPNDKNSILKKHISVTDYFEINYQDRLITFEFLALNFNNSQRNTYKYKLEGFDKDWHLAKDINKANYTNLDPGIYTFKVIASNNDGFWNDKGAQVTFKVKPPWYNTTIAQISFILFIILVLYVLIRWRTYRIQIKRKQLEVEVKEKTMELTASNQELMAQTEYLDKLNKLLEDRQKKVVKQADALATQSEALAISNKQLSELNNTKDKLFSIIAHDLLNPFNSIMGMSELLNSSYQQLSDEEKTELISNINSSSDKLFNLLQNLLLWARSQTSSVKFVQENFVIKEAIEESIAYLQDHLNNKNISFTIYCSDDITAYGDIDMFKTIIRNLVSNALKFTRKGGVIKIVVEQIGTTVSISVIDNGVGMNEKTMNKLFQADSISGTKGTDGERGTGLGLLICKEFVERNNGKIKVTSEKGLGSKFTFTIPESQW